MSVSLGQLRRWMTARECEHLEFKEAKQSYSADDLVKYCAALANEGGGQLVLGVTNRLPRRVVGTAAFPDLAQVTHNLLQRLRLRVQLEELAHSDGRVLVFTVPSRAVGMPVEVGGTYWMRAGESLTGMTPHVLKQIFDEAAPDFSAEVCPRATLGDLSGEAIEVFRRAWARKSSPQVAGFSVEQLLGDSELAIDGRVTVAALVLFGSQKALGRLLPQAEVVFEYRSSETSGPAQQRLDLRKGFFLFFDELWQAIAARNDVQHYQEGLFVWDVPTFDETVVREAVLNAVAHRDYRLQGSVFVRQHPRRIELVSPGGLPPGVTLENILWKQAPRNRRICEAFQRCGLVERSGQGMNRIYEKSIRQGKALPGFSGTDEYQVALCLHGTVEDALMVGFLEQVGQEQLASFTTEHFLALSEVQRSQKVSERLAPALDQLLELGVVERVSRGRYVPSRRYLSHLGRSGEYTRKKGLDRETNRMLLLKHIRESGGEGAKMEELLQVLPALSRHQVGRLLQSLRSEGKVAQLGRTKGGRWIASPGAQSAQ